MLSPSVSFPKRVPDAKIEQIGVFELLIRQPKQVLDDFQETNSLTGLFGRLYPSWYSRPNFFSSIWVKTCS